MHCPSGWFFVTTKPMLEIFRFRNGYASELGVPCVTLRDTTERPETVEIGTNLLLGTDASKIIPAVKNIRDKGCVGKIPEKWDGKAAERIVEALISLK